jgi:hypothetical protein
MPFKHVKRNVYYDRFLTAQERFEMGWQEDKNGCWIWKQSHCGNETHKYGGWSMNGKFIRAHRASWILFRGPIPDGLCVLHNCDVPSCVNPDHLRLGTLSDNRRDAVIRGRANFPLGERHGCSKLAEADVVAIRASTGTCKAVGKRYGISATQVCDIKRRKSWSHVE